MYHYSAAMNARGAGGVSAAGAGRWLPQPECFGEEDCGLDPGNVAATLVPRDFADALLHALGARAKKGEAGKNNAIAAPAGSRTADLPAAAKSVSVSFRRDDGPPLAFALDHRGRLAEVGHYARASLVGLYTS
jgi:hypothetical protein